jgi:hypothetical protein
MVADRCRPTGDGKEPKRMNAIKFATLILSATIAAILFFALVIDIVFPAIMHYQNSFELYMGWKP